MLKVKEYFNLDELKELGFEKARDYYHCGNVSVRICDRAIVASYVAKASRNPQSLRIPINNILGKMFEIDIISYGNS